MKSTLPSGNPRPPWRARRACRTGRGRRAAGLLLLLALASCRAAGTEIPSFGDDVRAIPKALWTDARRAFGRRENLLPLAGGALLSIAAESSAVEDAVEDHVERDAVLSDWASDLLDSYGEGVLMSSLAAAAYVWGSTQGDVETYRASKLTFRAMALTGLSTLALKAAIEDPRPDNKRRRDGFPSGHSSISMAFAVSLEETYGWRVGAPAYVLAGLVGLQRVESRRHDLSDVLFGWTLGFVVSKSVFLDGNPQLLGLDVAPYVDPQAGALGISLTTSF